MTRLMVLGGSLMQIGMKYGDISDLRSHLHWDIKIHW